MSAKEEKPKKGGVVKRLMVPLIAIIVLGGGGAAGGYYVASSMGGHAGEDPDMPKLVMKDGSTVSASEIGLKGESSKAGPKSKLKVTYYPMEEAFTSNLRGGGGFAQVKLAVSTYYDERVVKAMEEHNIAIRSAILTAMAEHDGMELETRDGKKKLKADLRDTINETLEEKTGFGGIDDVYFSSFVVQ